MGGLPSQACMVLSKEYPCRWPHSPNYEKQTGILMTQPTEPTTRSSSPLKNYRYIYFAFLEIIIKVHITLMEINSEGRYGMHGAMGRKKSEHPLVNLSKNWLKIMRMGARGIWELSILSTQFCHEPKTALKNSLLFKKYINDNFFVLKNKTELKY